MNKITLEELDKWIDGLEPKPQTTLVSLLKLNNFLSFI